MSLDEVKVKTSASQFVLWMEYLDWEANAFDKTCYYLAQLAAEVRKSYVKRGALVKIEDFILKFTHKKSVESKPADVRTRSGRMKQFFFGLTGFSGKRKRKK